MLHYAKKELALIKHDSYGLQNAMDECILDLLKEFDKQSHTNHTAPYCISMFGRLAEFKPITPLTGEDDEWVVHEKGDGTMMYQNKRYYAVFKEGRNGRAYNSEGKIFSKDGGKTWFTSKDSRIYIDFPYTVPDKPEYIILEKDGVEVRVDEPYSKGFEDGFDLAINMLRIMSTAARKDGVNFDIDTVYATLKNSGGAKEALKKMHTIKNKQPITIFDLI